MEWVTVYQVKNGKAQVCTIDGLTRLWCGLPPRPVRLDGLVQVLDSNGYLRWAVRCEPGSFIGLIWADGCSVFSNPVEICEI
jgi:hypothetical protein